MNYSNLTLFSLMMRAQRCCSERTNCWNSSGDAEGVNGTPAFVKASWIDGFCSTCDVAAANLSMIARGVFAGTKNPFQFTLPMPGKPAYVMVGTSGSSVRRFFAVVTKAFMRPALTCGVTVAAFKNEK